MGKVSRLRSRLGPAFDVAFVTVLAVCAQVEVWAAGLVEGRIPGPRGVQAVLLALICVPLLWRRRHPVAAFAVVVVAVLAQSRLEAGYGAVGRADEGALWAWIAALLVFYAVAAHGPPGQAALAGLLGGGAWLVIDVVNLLSGDAAPDETIPAWFLLAAAWGVGYAMRGRTLQVRALIDQAAREAREREAQAQAAVVEERARIARELHDVVAHGLSVIVVQAQAAQRVLDGEQPSAREALASIDTTGRQALQEMRRLVGMLREQDEASLRPQPGIGELPALIESVQEAGLQVELLVEGVSRPLPPGIDLSAYRIVQEALTNALKHAGPATARVHLRFGDDDLELEVVDDGGGGPSTALDDGTGHGLAGMRERVSLFGGALESGRRREGRGFRVRARLPI
jgi:signal transduction histidine kinase